MSNACFRGANLQRSNLVGTKGHGTNFSETNLYYARPGNADFEGFMADDRIRIDLEIDYDDGPSNYWPVGYEFGREIEEDADVRFFVATDDNPSPQLTRSPYFNYAMISAAVMTALIISFIVGPPLIRWLRSKQSKGQPIREDGPANHIVAKQGTPTMGGFLILLALSVATLLWADLRNPYVWSVLLVTVGFGIVEAFRSRIPSPTDP